MWVTGREWARFKEEQDQILTRKKVHYEDLGSQSNTQRLKMEPAQNAVNRMPMD